MRPECVEELAQIIRQADRPLSPVGGGSRLRPGEGQGARLEIGGLSGVVLYEPEALTLVVRAGTPLQSVRDLLASEGQMLAFEPDLRAGSTIGGMVAANASGARRVQAGACRDALIGVQFVDGRGEIIRNGGRVMKNVTGYDLVKLMAGSRGTLGVLTECAFKTAPIPQVSVTLALPDLGAKAAVAALIRALAGPFDVSGAGWLPGHGALLRLEGLEGSVTIRRQALAAGLAEFGALIEVPGGLWSGLVPQAGAGIRARIGADTGAGAAADTGARTGGGDLWRITCALTEAPAVLAHLPAPLGLDWGGALIWVELPPGQMPELPRWSGHAQRVTGAAPALLPPMNPIVARLNRDLRARFDPRGILAGEG